MFKRMLLCLMALVTLIASARAETPLRVMVNGGWMEMELLGSLPVELTETDDVVAEIANAFATRNDEIDIFVFPADQGLDLVKRKGYYAPLNGGKRLMQWLGGFYPEIQRVLTTDDGELAAWVMGASVLGMTVHQTSVLEDNGLTPPTTFGEMLDCCQAILAADALPAGMALLSNNPYTRESVLELYMDQYIRASRVGGGAVNFDTPEFVAMVERISTELPDHDSAFDRGTPSRAVFNYPVGFTMIDKDMLAVPQVLPDQAGLIDVHLSVAVVNPYSKRVKAAVDLLNLHIAGYRIPSYIYDASLDMGLRAKNVDVRVEDLEKEIAALEALEERTADQQEKLDEMLALYDACFIVSPDDVAAYHALSDGISVFDGSPVCYDSFLRQAAGRYLHGELTAEGFARECQNHIAMIYEENGIPMN